MDKTCTQRKYVMVLAALLYVASFLFPWFDIRANRVVAPAACWIVAMGIQYFFLLVLPPAVLSALVFGGKLRTQEWAIVLLPPLAIVTALGTLPHLGSLFAFELGEFGRMGLGFGFYLYCIAGLVFIIPSERSRYALPVLLTSIVAAVFFIALYGGFDHLGIVKEAINQRRRLGSELVNHINITLLSVGIAALAGIPAAVLAYQFKGFKRAVFPFMNILQTVPSLALFGLMIAPLAALSQAVPLLRRMGIRGIGNAPAIIALSLYALYPVIRYSYTGLASIDRKIIDAGKGMGMSSGQLWHLVRLPLCIPAILHGLRVAFIQTLGNATLAKLIGGNGLGVFVFEGLGQAASDMVLLGMFLIILLTVSADQILGYAVVHLTPKALRNRYGGNYA